MTLFKRPKHPSKGHKQYWYSRIQIPTTERKPNGKKVYTNNCISLGDTRSVTKAMALHIDLKREQKLKQGKLKALLNPPSLGAFSKEYLDYQKGQGKRAWSRDELSIRHLIAFVGVNIKLSDISVKDVDMYKVHRLKSVSRATLARELTCFRRMLNLAIKWDEFEGKNPVSESGVPIVKNKRERVLTVEEQDKLFDVLPRYFLLLIIAFLLSGMRRRELVLLRKEQVNLQKRIISLKAEDTKEGKRKDIPISDFLAIILELAMSESNHVFVFSNWQGNPWMAPYLVTLRFRYYVQRAGLEDITLHDLRHTFTTRVNEKKGNLRALQEILGHSDLNMLARYAHPTESKREAVSIAESYLDIEKLSQRLSQGGFKTSENTA